MRRTIWSIVVAASISILLTAPCAYAGTPLGKFCFKLTDYADVFVWDIEVVGSSTFSVTGMNTANQSAMFGGGSIIAGDVKLIVMESASGASVYNGLHSIKIDIGTLSGIDDIQFHKGDGTNIFLGGKRFTRVSCP